MDLREKLLRISLVLVLVLVGRLADMHLQQVLRRLHLTRAWELLQAMREITRHRSAVDMHLHTSLPQFRLHPAPLLTMAPVELLHTPDSLDPIHHHLGGDQDSVRMVLLRGLPLDPIHHPGEGQDSVRMLLQRDLLLDPIYHHLEDQDTVLMLLQQDLLLDPIHHREDQDSVRMVLQRDLPLVSLGQQRPPVKLLPELDQGLVDLRSPELARVVDLLDSLLHLEGLPPRSLRLEDLVVPVAHTNKDKRLMGMDITNRLVGEFVVQLEMDDGLMRYERDELQCKGGVKER